MKKRKENTILPVLSLKLDMPKYLNYVKYPHKI